MLNVFYIIFTALPGARADAFLFQRSQLPAWCLEKVLGGGKDLFIEGTYVREHILSDSGF
jgi:hypothetical protein